MKTGINGIRRKIKRAVMYAVACTAIIVLALSKFLINITRLSSAELSGIALFAFVLAGLVSLFAVTRMNEKRGSRIFAALINFSAVLSALWFLFQLFSDEIFFRNLYFSRDRVSGVYELLPLAGRIFASLPLALVVLSAAVYFLSGLIIAILVREPAEFSGKC